MGRVEALKKLREVLGVEERKTEEQRGGGGARRRQGEEEEKTATVVPAGPRWTDEVQYDVVDGRLRSSTLVGFVQYLEQNEVEALECDAFLSTLTWEWCEHPVHLFNLLVERCEALPAAELPRRRLQRFCTRWLLNWPKDFTAEMRETCERVMGVAVQQHEERGKASIFSPEQGEWDAYAVELARRAGRYFIWFASKELPRDVVKMVVPLIMRDREAWHQCEAFKERRWWKLNHLDGKFPQSLETWSLRYDAKEIAECIHALGREEWCTYDFRRDLAQASVATLEA